ncbi:aldo/keto reductase [Streptomyces alkaliterrae]|uniref:Aldo/keto reductase n=1 Tax=Streptomyces alkaliterrae TaxID=2213162 RepID=A0A5P0YMD2_9ACTN|nr:aldo/keto reductase [Streptomyces alkaliterrae]MBB1255942.1 aldo/keto reductase [Streptomyces alkaliterrae]MBB1261967.1 aldo/keto reductase [Streptomyces alkaliterrae]MQS01465.1 aldo/keto reductase [Streptomyces alkaliterrae]
MPFTRLAEATTPTARIGLGLAAVGRPGYLNLGRDRDLPAERSADALRDRTRQLLDAAYAQGVRYVDTARSYGRAEEFLGEWLQEHPEAGEVVVGSKWGYVYTANWRVSADVHEVKEHSLAMFRTQRAETGQLLGDHLDLYQVHSVTPDSPVLTDAEMQRALAELVEEGVSVGLSVSGPDQAEAVRRALEVTVDGEPLFRSVQATCNLLEPSVGEALAEAHDAGRWVIVKEAMANGRLAPERAPEELRRIAEECDAACDAVALAVMLYQPWATVVLSGAATVEQLFTNLHAVTVDLTEEQRERLAALAEPPADYWRHRSDLTWA